MEEWKPIVEVDGAFEISNYGNIRSVDRYARVCGNGRRFIKGQPIKPCVCKNGYLEAQIHYKGKLHIWLLHRLVALYFIENPYNYPEVNHKDENIKNNCMNNLEWCTSKYNANYGSRNKRCLEKAIKFPVVQLSLNNEFIARFESMKEAERQTGIDSSQISRVCKGKNNTAGGYIWKFD